MPREFDPYHRWLGIPPEEQPPDHYCLLGLVTYESDPEVIRDAAERQMAHVRRYGLGKHSQLSQEILNELASAKACLLDPVKKAEYDIALRDRYEQRVRGTPPSPLQPSEVSGPRPATTSSSTQAPHGDPGRSAAGSGGRRWAALLRPLRLHARLVLTLGLAVTCGVVLWKVLLSGREELGETRLVLDWPEEERAGATLTIDGSATTPVPAHGPLEYPLEPGNHMLVGKRPGFNPSVMTVKMDQGTTKEIRPVWIILPPPPERAPRLMPVADQTVGAGTKLEFTVLLQDPGTSRGRLRYRLGPGAPPGAGIDPEKGVFSWTPAEDEGGQSHRIAVQVVAPEAGNLGDEVAFVVHVNKLNRPPVLVAIENRSARSGEALSFRATAFSPNQPPNKVTFSLVQKPDGAEIGRASGLFTWTPRPNQAGKSYDVTVLATDDSPDMMKDQKTLTIRVEADVPPEPPPPKPKPKYPEPDEKAKGPAVADMRKVFEEDYKDRSPQARVALAKRLRERGVEIDDNPVTRFVMLQEAATLAVGAGDFEMALEIVDRLDQWYEVHVLAMKADALEKYLKSSIRSATAPFATLAEQLASEARKKADLNSARRFLNVTLAAVRKLKDKVAIIRVQTALNELKALEKRQEEVQQALVKLKDNSEDPAANSAVGSWYCLVVFDWERGIPYLAKGEDAALAGLARQDLADPHEPHQRAELGDRWWEMAEAKGGTDKAPLQLRAIHWYRQALPGLTGMPRFKVEKRLDDLGVRSGQYALKFDGKRSHVIIPGFGYNGQSPITVEAIVQPEPQAAGLITGIGIVSGVVISNSSSGEFSIENAAGLSLATRIERWTFAFHHGRETSSYSSCARVQAESRSGSDWVHLAGVYDGREIRLYVGGSLQGSTPVTGPHKFSLLPFVVGASPSIPTVPKVLPVKQHFAGMIKAVRVSQAAIYTHDFQPPTVLDAGSKSTKLLLRFDRGKGEEVRDAVNANIVAQVKDAEWVNLDAGGAERPASAGRDASEPREPVARPSDREAPPSPHRPPTGEP